MTILQSPLHRIPTLWSLYRPLVVATRSIPLALNQQQALYQYIRDSFKRYKKLGNVEKIKRKWIEAEQVRFKLFPLSILFIVVSYPVDVSVRVAVTPIRIIASLLYSSRSNATTSFPPCSRTNSLSSSSFPSRALLSSSSKTSSNDPSCDSIRSSYAENETST